LAVTLRAPELARRDARPLDLFMAEAKADRALPRLAAELAADLGEDRIGTLSLVSSWIPEERTRLVPFGAPSSAPSSLLASSPAYAPLVSRAAEPVRLVAPLPCGSLRGVKLLARVEAAEWWHRGIEARDFLAAWTDAERAMAWIEMDRVNGQARIRGWMD
jgi:protein ImuB